MNVILPRPNWYRVVSDWFRRAAARDDPEAMFDLGWLREMQSRDDPTDPDGALVWYRRAAEAGHPDGMWKLGCWRERHGPVDAGPDSAVVWFRRAVETGHVDAMIELGLIRHRQRQIDDDAADGAAIRGFVAWPISANPQRCTTWAICANLQGRGRRR